MSMEQDELEHLMFCMDEDTYFQSESNSNNSHHRENLANHSSSEDHDHHIKGSNIIHETKNTNDRDVNYNSLEIHHSTTTNTSVLNGSSSSYLLNKSSSDDTAQSSHLTLDSFFSPNTASLIGSTSPSLESYYSSTDTVNEARVDAILNGISDLPISPVLQTVESNTKSTSLVSLLSENDRSRSRKTTKPIAVPKAPPRRGARVPTPRNSDHDIISGDNATSVNSDSMTSKSKYIKLNHDLDTTKKLDKSSISTTTNTTLDTSTSSSFIGNDSDIGKNKGNKKNEKDTASENNMNNMNRDMKGNTSIKPTRKTKKRNTTQTEDTQTESIFIESIHTENATQLTNTTLTEDQSMSDCMGNVCDASTLSTSTSSLTPLTPESSLHSPSLNNLNSDLNTLNCDLNTLNSDMSDEIETNFETNNTDEVNNTDETTSTTKTTSTTNCHSNNSDLPLDDTHSTSSPATPDIDTHSSTHSLETHFVTHSSVTHSDPSDPIQLTSDPIQLTNNLHSVNNTDDPVGSDNSISTNNTSTNNTSTNNSSTDNISTDKNSEPTDSDISTQEPLTKQLSGKKMKKNLTGKDIKKKGLKKANDTFSTGSIDSTEITHNTETTETTHNTEVTDNTEITHTEITRNIETIETHKNMDHTSNVDGSIRKETDTTNTTNTTHTTHTIDTTDTTNTTHTTHTIDTTDTTNTTHTTDTTDTTNTSNKTDKTTKTEKKNKSNKKNKTDKTNKIDKTNETTKTDKTCNINNMKNANNTKKTNNTNNIDHSELPSNSSEITSVDTVETNNCDSTQSMDDSLISNVSDLDNSELLDIDVNMITSKYRDDVITNLLSHLDLISHSVPGNLYSLNTTILDTTNIGPVHTIHDTDTEVTSVQIKRGKADNKTCDDEMNQDMTDSSSNPSQFTNDSSPQFTSTHSPLVSRDHSTFMNGILTFAETSDISTLLSPSEGSYIVDDYDDSKRRDGEYVGESGSGQAVNSLNETTDKDQQAQLDKSTLESSGKIKRRGRPPKLKTLNKVKGDMGILPPRISHQTDTPSSHSIASDHHNSISTDHQPISPPTPPPTFSFHSQSTTNTSSKSLLKSPLKSPLKSIHKSSTKSPSKSSVKIGPLTLASTTKTLASLSPAVLRKMSRQTRRQSHRGLVGVVPNSMTGLEDEDEDGDSLTDSVSIKNKGRGRKKGMQAMIVPSDLLKMLCGDSDTESESESKNESDSHVSNSQNNTNTQSNVPFNIGCLDNSVMADLLDYNHVMISTSPTSGQTSNPVPSQTETSQTETSRTETDFVLSDVPVKASLSSNKPKRGRKDKNMRLELKLSRLEDDTSDVDSSFFSRRRARQSFIGVDRERKDKEKSKTMKSDEYRNKSIQLDHTVSVASVSKPTSSSFFEQNREVTISSSGLDSLNDVHAMDDKFEDSNYMQVTNLKKSVDRTVSEVNDVVNTQDLDTMMTDDFISPPTSHTVPDGSAHISESDHTPKTSVIDSSLQMPHISSPSTSSKSPTLSSQNVSPNKSTLQDTSVHKSVSSKPFSTSTLVYNSSEADNLSFSTTNSLRSPNTNQDLSQSTECLDDAVGTVDTVSNPTEQLSASLSPSQTRHSLPTPVYSDHIPPPTHTSTSIRPARTASRPTPKHSQRTTSTHVDTPNESSLPLSPVTAPSVTAPFPTRPSRSTPSSSNEVTDGLNKTGIHDTSRFKFLKLPLRETLEASYYTSLSLSTGPKSQSKTIAEKNNSLSFQNPRQTMFAPQTPQGMARAKAEKEALLSSLPETFSVALVSAISPSTLTELANIPEILPHPDSSISIEDVVRCVDDVTVCHILNVINEDGSQMEKTLEYMQKSRASILNKNLKVKKSSSMSKTDVERSSHNLLRLVNILNYSMYQHDLYGQFLLLSPSSSAPNSPTSSSRRSVSVRRSSRLKFSKSADNHFEKSSNVSDKQETKLSRTNRRKRSDGLNVDGNSVVPNQERGSDKNNSVDDDVSSTDVAKYHAFNQLGPLSKVFYRILASSSSIPRNCGWIFNDIYVMEHMVNSLARGVNTVNLGSRIQCCVFWHELAYLIDPDIHIAEEVVLETQLANDVKTKGIKSDHVVATPTKRRAVRQSMEDTQDSSSQTSVSVRCSDLNIAAMRMICDFEAFPTETHVRVSMADAIKTHIIEMSLYIVLYINFIKVLRIAKLCISLSHVLQNLIIASQTDSVSLGLRSSPMDMGLGGSSSVGGDSMTKTITHMAKLVSEYVSLIEHFISVMVRLDSICMMLDKQTAVLHQATPILFNKLETAGFPVTYNFLCRCYLADCSRATDFQTTQHLEDLKTMKTLNFPLFVDHPTFSNPTNCSSSCKNPECSRYSKDKPVVETEKVYRDYLLEYMTAVGPGALQLHKGYLRTVSQHRSSAKPVKESIQQIASPQTLLPSQPHGSGPSQTLQYLNQQQYYSEQLRYQLAQNSKNMIEGSLNSPLPPQDVYTERKKNQLLNSHKKMIDRNNSALDLDEVVDEGRKLNQLFDGTASDSQSDDLTTAKTTLPTEEPDVDIRSLFAKSSNRKVDRDSEPNDVDESFTNQKSTSSKFSYSSHHSLSSAPILPPQLQPVIVSQKEIEAIKHQQIINNHQLMLQKRLQEENLIAHQNQLYLAQRMMQHNPHLQHSEYLHHMSMLMRENALSDHNLLDHRSLGASEDPRMGHSGTLASFRNNTEFSDDDLDEELEHLTRKAGKSSLKAFNTSLKHTSDEISSEDQPGIDDVDSDVDTVVQDGEDGQGEDGQGEDSNNKLKYHDSMCDSVYDCSEDDEDAEDLESSYIRKMNMLHIMKQLEREETNSTQPNPRRLLLEQQLKASGISSSDLSKFDDDHQKNKTASLKSVTTSSTTPANVSETVSSADHTDKSSPVLPALPRATNVSPSDSDTPHPLVTVNPHNPSNTKSKIRLRSNRNLTNTSPLDEGLRANRPIKRSKPSVGSDKISSSALDKILSEFSTLKTQLKDMEADNMQLRHNYEELRSQVAASTSHSSLSVREDLRLPQATDDYLSIYNSQMVEYQTRSSNMSVHSHSHHFAPHYPSQMTMPYSQYPNLASSQYFPHGGVPSHSMSRESKPIGVLDQSMEIEASLHRNHINGNVPNMGNNLTSHFTVNYSSMNPGVLPSNPHDASHPYYNQYPQYSSFSYHEHRSPTQQHKSLNVSFSKDPDTVSHLSERSRRRGCVDPISPVSVIDAINSVVYDDHDGDTPIRTTTQTTQSSSRYTFNSKHIHDGESQSNVKSNMKSGSYQDTLTTPTIEEVDSDGECEDEEDTCETNERVSKVKTTSHSASQKVNTRHSAGSGGCLNVVGTVVESPAGFSSLEYSPIMPNPVNTSDSLKNTSNNVTSNVSNNNTRTSLKKSKKDVSGKSPLDVPTSHTSIQNNSLSNVESNDGDGGTRRLRSQLKLPSTPSHYAQHQPSRHTPHVHTNTSINTTASSSKNLFNNSNTGINMSDSGFFAEGDPDLENENTNISRIQSVIPNDTDQVVPVNGHLPYPNPNLTIRISQDSSNNSGLPSDSNSGLASDSNINRTVLDLVSHQSAIIERQHQVILELSNSSNHSNSNFQTSPTAEHQDSNPFDSSMANAPSIKTTTELWRSKSDSQKPPLPFNSASRRPIPRLDLPQPELSQPKPPGPVSTPTRTAPPRPNKSKVKKPTKP